MDTEDVSVSAKKAGKTKNKINSVRSKSKTVLGDEGPKVSPVA